MGHIVPRKRKDGSTGYTAQIVLKRDGKVIHREAKTFDRKQAANAWMARREGELSKPGAIERSRQANNDPKLGEVIDRYVAESEKLIGRTKAQVLRTIKTYDIAELRCSEIASKDLVAFAQSLNVNPSTRQNYLSHLSAIFSIARPAWGYPLEYQTIKDTFAVTKRLGVTGKAKRRERRPTLTELDRLMDHFGKIKARRPSSLPMQRIVAFAIFSTRRQEEIVTIRRSDYEGHRVLVRNMKHPGEKIGNDTWCEIVPEAAAIIDAHLKLHNHQEIFPYSTDAVSAAFTRACKFLNINTDDMPDDECLHFHDLRHEGVSRLFEIGRTIPMVANVSGHRSWQSLQRYTHLQQIGDKYAGWKWLNIVS